VMPVMLAPVCNTFTYKDYVKPQWKELRDMYDETIGKVLGPLVTQGSDGDSRRRLGMHSESTFGRDDVNFVTLNAPGFVYKAWSDGPGRVPISKADQDWIHCAKKIINAFASKTRTLQVGPNAVAFIGFLAAFVSGVDRDVHGIRDTDLDRSGYGAMDWPSAFRLVTHKALAAMKARARPQAMPYLTGCVRVLGLVRDFVSMFANPNLTFLDRVQRAAKVVTYLRLWRGWVVNTAGQSVDVNFITREGMFDIILACHNVVLVMKTVRDYLPRGTVIDWRRLGTDCCEDFFSSLGSFTMNKRTYCIGEAVETTRSSGVLRMLEAAGAVQVPKRKGGSWVEDWAKEEGDNEEVRRLPTDEEMVTTWEKGIAEARTMATTDGMRPPNRGRMPEWWTKPEVNDTGRSNEGREGHRGDRAGRDEEEVVADDEEGKEDGNEDDAGDEGDNNGGGGGGGDDDDDDDDDDDRPLLLRALAVARNRGNGSNERGEESRNKKPSLKIRVPDRPEPVTKRQVIAGFNTGTQHLSSDRTLRVQQSRPKKEEASAFEISEDSWEMRIGSDVALWTTPNIWICRVLRMRMYIENKKGKSDENKKRNRKSEDKTTSKKGGRWVEYTKPVILHTDRKPLEGLHVTCYFYKRVEGPKGEERYRYNHADWNEYPIESIICPVALSFNPGTRGTIGTSYYVLAPETRKILAAQKKGLTEYDYDAPNAAKRRKK